MAAVVVPAVHQDGVQDVVCRIFDVRLLQELVQGQLLGKLEPGERRDDIGGGGGRRGHLPEGSSERPFTLPVIYLDVLVCLRVVHKPHQLQMQNGGECQKLHPLLSFL